jgi:hypothetical protein
MWLESGKREEENNEEDPARHASRSENDPSQLHEDGLHKSNKFEIMKPISLVGLPNALPISGEPAAESASR